MFTFVGTFVGCGRRREDHHSCGLGADESAIFVERSREIPSDLMLVFLLGGAAKGHRISLCHRKCWTLQDHTIGHCDVDGVAAGPLFRLTPVHAAVRRVGVLDGAGRLAWEPPAELAWLKRPRGGVPSHRPAAGVGRRRTPQRDVVVLEELRSVGSDAQSGCGGSQTGSQSLLSGLRLI